MAMATHGHLHKRRRVCPAATGTAVAPLDTLADELLFLVLDRVAAADPRALKSFALASRGCRDAESRHRRVLRPFRADLLRAALARYPSASSLDLTLCPRVTDAALSSAVPLPSLRAVDLSNGVDLGDAAAAEVARARGLRRLCLSRCKPITDMGLGCVAVGCPDLREVTLNWCLGITDLGVRFLALKCKKIRILNLSYTMVSLQCFLVISPLPSVAFLGWKDSPRLSFLDFRNT